MSLMYKHDAIIYNFLVSENDTQLQQGCSPNFYLVGGKHIPTENRNLEVKYWGGEFLKVDELVIKQIFKQRLSFFILQSSVTMRNTYQLL